MKDVNFMRAQAWSMTINPCSTSVTFSCGTEECHLELRDLANLLITPGGSNPPIPLIEMISERPSRFDLTRITFVVEGFSTYIDLGKGMIFQIPIFVIK